MLGQTVRESRIKKGLTQARLASLAGVSRRHLAALEKGANVSVLVLKKVATVLDLREIQLGDLSLVSGGGDASRVNMPLLAETIRDARSGAIHVENLLAQAEALAAARRSDSESAKNGGAADVASSFPRLTPRTLDVKPDTSLPLVADAPESTRVEVSGDVRQGEPVEEREDDEVTLPGWLVDDGEVVFRARGAKLHDVGIEDGDLLVVELRTSGRAATGELVIAKIGDVCWIGRMWQKHGHRVLLTDALSEVVTGSTRGLKVVAAINQIVRGR